MKGLRTTSEQFKNVLAMLQGEDYATVALGVEFWSQMGPYNKWKIYNKLYTLHLSRPRNNMYLNWVFYTTIGSCTMDIIRDGKVISIFLKKTNKKVTYIYCNTK